jgi:hypothetical protein
MELFVVSFDTPHYDTWPIAALAEEYRMEDQLARKF